MRTIYNPSPLSILHAKLYASFSLFIFFIVLVNDGRTATVPRYDGLGSAFVTIVKKEGVKGLYRGVTPNVWGSGSAWGFYFLL